MLDSSVTGPSSVIEPPEPGVCPLPPIARISEFRKVPFPAVASRIWPAFPPDLEPARSWPPEDVIAATESVPFSVVSKTFPPSPPLLVELSAPAVMMLPRNEAVPFDDTATVTFPPATPEPAVAEVLIWELEVETTSESAERSMSPPRVLTFVKNRILSPAAVRLPPWVSSSCCSKVTVLSRPASASSMSAEKPGSSPRTKSCFTPLESVMVSDPVGLRKSVSSNPSPSIRLVSSVVLPLSLSTTFGSAPAGK